MTRYTASLFARQETCTQLVGCFHLLLINLEFPAFDVDGSKLAIVFSLQLRTNLGPVERIAPTSKLYFGVPALVRGHGNPPSLLVRPTVRWHQQINALHEGILPSA